MHSLYLFFQWHVFKNNRLVRTISQKSWYPKIKSFISNLSTVSFMYGNQLQYLYSHIGIWAHHLYMYKARMCILDRIIAVLRIRDVYTESRIRIFSSRLPDPFFSSRFLDPGSKRSRILIRIKEFKYPKKSFLSSRKHDLGCSSRIRF